MGWVAKDVASIDAAGYVCEWEAPQASCSGSAGTMVLVSGGCQERRCTETTQIECIADPACEWASATGCTQKPCTEVLTELACDLKEGCRWMASISPSMCVQEPCAQLTDQPTCNASGNCLWDESEPVVKCVAKNCNDMPKCECVGDPDCYWKADGQGSCRRTTFGQCPTLDIVVVFDGSSSMSQAFGHHPHGFYAVMEMFRRWLASLPLSNERAGAVSARGSEKVRVALVQFSGRQEFYNAATNAFYGPIVSSVAVAPVGVGTAGRLSGSYAELTADVDWHEQSFLEGGTFIARALATAGTIFTQQSPEDGRKRVLLIVADGMLQDSDSLAAARQVLDGHNVQTFGVVVRRFTAATQTDMDAEKTLRPIVSKEASQHFMNVELDSFSKRVLNGICDPNGVWGSLVVPASSSSGHKPCKDYRDKEPCVNDGGCAWSDVLTACLDSPCVAHCEQPDCVRDTVHRCTWDSAVAECFAMRTCAYSERPACIADVRCMWDSPSDKCVEKPCTHPDENSCIADATSVCLWKSLEQACSLKPCQHPDAASCDDDSRCEWDAACSQQCAEKPCQSAAAEECGADARCVWDGAECAAKPCAEHSSERCCNADADCHWDVQQAPALCSRRPCLRFASPAPCDDERSCMWNAAAQKCTAKSCALLGSGDRCACEADADCFFVDSSPRSHCTFQRYGACPTLDVVLLLDGGASMSRAFGRHPHGFHAVTALVRDWAATLPLGGDAAAAQPAAGSRTARVGIVQFAGSAQWPAGDAKQALTPPPTGMPDTSGGRLTGVLFQVAADLDFHESRFMGGSLSSQPHPRVTYLLAAFNKAASLFRTSPVDGRKRVLIIVAHGPLHDKDQYHSVKTELAQMQVQTFAIAVRALSMKSTTDEQTEADLKAFVASDPPSEHVRALTTDQLRAALSSLCDPNDEWGKFVAGGHAAARQPCILHASKHVCNKDAGCVWFDTTLSCGDSPCLQHCADTPCVGDAGNLCEWDARAKSCGKHKICDYQNPAQCIADSNCYVMDGGDGVTCAEKKCQHSNEQGCTVDPDVCIWNAVARSCGESPCAFGGRGECESNGCVWNAPVLRCEPQKCGYPTKLACEDTEPGKCQWKANECVTAPCKQHSDERSCYKDEQCAWLAECEVAYCARYSGESACDADGACMWSAAGPSCVAKACGAFAGDACRCRRDPDCYWDEKAATCETAALGECPGLDIVVAIDGSASMRLSFGLHPHGFYGMIHILEQWVRDLSLTGEPAGTLASSVEGKARVGVIQFSGRRAVEIPGTGVVDGARRAPTGVGSGGRLTGDATEVAADFEWHARNFAGAGAFVRAALDAAADMFGAPGEPGRARVLLVVAAGAVEDADDLPPARGRLETAGVATFGIVLRRFASSTGGDLDAEAALKPLTSIPHAEHYRNVRMESVPAVLGSLCDPNSAWGKFVVAQGLPGDRRPCRNHASKEPCVADRGCVYEDVLTACVDSGCLKHCSEADCAADACAWDAGEGACYKVESCAYSTQPACELAGGCAWTGGACAERECSLPDENSCLAEPGRGCVWEVDKCVVRPCRHVGAEACRADPGCTWNDNCGSNPADHACTPKLCGHAGAAACGAAAPQCGWDGAGCRASTCAGYPGERCCNRDGGCRWNVDVSPAVCSEAPCAKFAEAECGAARGCLWAASEKKCTGKVCANIGSRCGCDGDPDCFWSASADGLSARCTEQRFGTCPTLDVVLLVAGGPAAGRPFGRHPHGFYALLHIIREWAASLPLSGEPAGAPSAGGTRAARVALLQFAGTAAYAPSDPRQYLASSGPATSGGRLTGDRLEVAADARFHEANFMAADGAGGAPKSYLLAGLARAVALLRGSPVDGRRRVVVVVSVDELGDTGVYGPARAELDQVQAEVFGVVVRAARTRTPVDAKAEESLRGVVGEPKAEHLRNVVVDELHGVLGGVCDPNDPWGAFVAAAGGARRPCVLYRERSACTDDSGCVWFDASLSCGDSPCLNHCTRQRCAADAGVNLCAWNPAAAACEKQKLCDHSDVKTCEADAACRVAEDGATCVGKRCEHDNEQGCLADPFDCAWNNLETRCHERPCSFDSRDVCELNGCAWTSSSVCELKKCDYKTENACVSNEPGLCEWKEILGVEECTVAPCRGYSTENACMGDEHCSWATAVAPGGCRLKYCRQYCSGGDCDERRCEKDAECVFDNSTSTPNCVQKACGMLTDACGCKRDADCFWKVTNDATGSTSACVEIKYGACPRLDVVVLFDGSASMQLAMGRHPHGFHAVIELLKAWVSALPLSRTKAGDATPSRHGQVRVAFVQFSGAPLGPVVGPVARSAIKTPSGVGTSGQLSGDAAELAADLDWHGGSYMGQGTYVALALEMAADTLAAAPADGRRKVAVVVLNGRLQDADVLSASREKLATAGAEVFGVAVRRSPTRTAADAVAEASLKPLVSASQEAHFAGVELDRFASDSGPLAQICDPRAPFGAVLASGPAAGAPWPCALHASEAPCAADAGCVWSEAQLSCATSPCVSHCDRAACAADTFNACAASTPDGSLVCARQLACPHADRGSCEGDGRCVWSSASSECAEKKCGHATEDGCLADALDVCAWNDAAGCFAMPCAEHESEASCAADAASACQWKADACRQKACIHVDKTPCDADVLCAWDDTETECVERPCVEHEDDRMCNADLRCAWDVSTAPGSCQFTRCARYGDEADCGLDAGCQWAPAGAGGVCVRRTCGGAARPCDCARDPRCFWSTTGGRGRCEALAFGKCPTMDAVLVVDGSAAMAKPFGRHPHGFLALAEMLKAWVQSLPLSGEPASVGPLSTLTGGIRLGFVQFSGSSSSIGALGGVVKSAVKTPPAVGAGGRLSGDGGQLVEDVAWHEDNVVGRAIYAEEGLSMAADLFSNDSPTDGRRRVVLLITSGVLADAARLDTARARLDQLQVITFGIVLRRFTARTSSDDAAESVLKPVLSEPGDEHFMSLTLAEVPDSVLYGLCDPHNAWGRIVSAQSVGSAGPGNGTVPCPQYTIKNECNADRGCVWGASTSTCAVTSCVEHCSEEQCVADAPNGCGWDPVAGCVKQAACGHPSPAACAGDAECRWAGGGCAAKRCRHADEEPCLSDPEGCVYDSTLRECSEEPCKAKLTEQSCSAEGVQCEWEVNSNRGPARGTCVPQRCSVCAANNQTCCEEVTRALWCEYESSTGACQQRRCVGYADELQCASEKKGECHWDASTSPSMCRQRYCSRFEDDTVCNLEGRCYWDFGTCLDRLCTDVGDRCACTSDPSCFWHDGVCVDIHYGACPTMDIVVLIDGSSYMAAAFGRHPHGFYALLEIMREWATLLPLAGDLGKAAAAGTGYAPGLTRIAFVQYSGNAKKRQPTDPFVEGSAAVAPVETGAGGRLSGYAPEVRADLDWHQRNMLGADTFVAAALDRAGGLLSGAPGDGRRKVVVVLQGSRARDLDRVDGPLAKLQAAGAHVFGVVVRKAAQHAAAEDLAAEESLLQLVSEPRSMHFVNTPIDSLHEDVFEKWCHPGALWAGWLVSVGADAKVPCGFHASPHACGKDAACAWDDALVVCTKSPCLQLCSSSHCDAADANLRCVWDGDTATCTKRRVCAHSTKPDCLRDLECTWATVQPARIDPATGLAETAAENTCEPLACKHTTEAACLIDDAGCAWVASKSTDNCGVKSCPFVSSTACTAAPECVWDNVASVCGEKACGHTARASCESDIKCVWDTLCAEKPCVRHLNEVACNTEAACDWDVSVSPAYCKQTYCARWQAASDCDGDAQCAWDSQARTCVTSRCDEMSTQCACMQIPGCFWTDASQACVAAVFGGCPALDIVVLIDGSSTMDRAFGRHPSGFAALLAMLQDWVRLLPLTGDSYKAGLAASTTGVRVGFIAFSAAGQFVATKTTGARGMLSGSLAELVDDLAFHSESKAGEKQRHMLPALTHAMYMFQNSPPSARQRVFLMVSQRQVGRCGCVGTSTSADGHRRRDLRCGGASPAVPIAS
eukprot:gene23434-biopygen984